MFDNPKNVFFINSLDEPIHENCRREIATYDNGEPVCWVDIPFGTRSWEPMYLCTEAARIYMMSDEEFDEYEKEQLSKKIDDISDKVFIKYLTWFVLIGLILSAFVCVSFFFSMWLSAILLILEVSYIGVCSFLLYHTAHKPVPIGIEAGSDEEQILKQLENFNGDEVLVGYTSSCANQIKQLSAEIEEINELLDELFSEGSITWHRYYDTVLIARDNVMTNANALLHTVEYANGNDDVSVQQVCMNKASRILADNKRVMESVQDLHENMKSFVFNEYISDTSSNVSYIVDEVDALSDDLVLYRTE